MSLRVLVACENSGIVRDSFAALGHDAWSCDILDSDRPAGNHVKNDAIEVAYSQKWDVLVCHPPCTFLTVANNRNWRDREKEQREAVRFALLLWSAPVRHVCLENPVGFLNTAWMPATQIIQPFWFGHRELKRTCLWLKNLPLLTAGRNVARETYRLAVRRRQRLAYMGQRANRWKLRSRTYPGIAAAMASQWSEFVTGLAGLEASR